jgi:hypothetical protein
MPTIGRPDALAAQAYWRQFWIIRPNHAQGLGISDLGFGISDLGFGDSAFCILHSDFPSPDHVSLQRILPALQFEEVIYLAL